MLRRSDALTPLVIALLALRLPHAHAAPVRVPGTGVTIDAPAGFEPSTSFPGFGRADLQSSIMVTEMPAPFAGIREGMVKEKLATRGMVLLSSGDVSVSGRLSVLLKVAQEAAGQSYLKWVLVTGTDRKSVTIVGTYPRSAEGQVGEAMRKALLGVTWSPDPPKDVYEGLPFRVKPTSKLRLAGRVGNMLALNASGALAPARAGDPFYIVGRSVSDAAIRQLRAFAEARARRTETLRSIRIVQGRPLRIDGLPAYELLAAALDVKSGMPVHLYQVVAVDGQAYWIAQGVVSAGRFAEWLPEFRKVTASLRASR